MSDRDASHYVGCPNCGAFVPVYAAPSPVTAAGEERRVGTLFRYCDHDGQERHQASINSQSLRTLPEGDFTLYVRFPSGPASSPTSAVAPGLREWVEGKIPVEASPGTGAMGGNYRRGYEAALRMVLAEIDRRAAGEVEP